VAKLFKGRPWIPLILHGFFIALKYSGLSGNNRLMGLIEDCVKRMSGYE
jgi:hypothetical protein